MSLQELLCGQILNTLGSKYLPFYPFPHLERNE